jgi:predicted enzyme involved in methoxymalonyl-ACP biosynthesis
VVDRIDARLKEFTTATINLVLCDQNGIGNKAEITKKYEDARTQLSEEIQRLRAEVERLTTENTGLQSDLERACQLINAALDDYRGAVATTMERAAQIVDDMPARSNYAIYDAIAAAIRAEASKKGGEG